MGKSILVGNGINIQFGGKDVYSSSAIMNRVVENIKANKYSELVENALSVDDQIEILAGLVRVIDGIKKGGFTAGADGLFALMECDRIKRTYPDNSSITSVFLEDYFLAAEIFNNGFKNEDGEEKNEFYRKCLFDFLRRIIVDGIYNDGEIDRLHESFNDKLKTFFSKFEHVFTTNYDENIEQCTGQKVVHLHGVFSKLAPEYDTSSKYYQCNKTECDSLIEKKVSGMDHVYSNAVMSWSWLDKYGELIEEESLQIKNEFSSIAGQLEILGLSPTNDEHLFLMINQNPNIKSVVYYYMSDNDRTEILRHIKKPVTFKSVMKLWKSLK